MLSEVTAQAEYDGFMTDSKVDKQSKMKDIERETSPYNFEMLKQSLTDGIESAAKDKWKKVKTEHVFLFPFEPVYDGHQDKLCDQ
eukprot:9580139-Heterocapsa_arctica.AAC.1